MTEDEFWGLIDTVRRLSDGGIDTKPLKDVLVKMSPSDIQAFHQRFLTYYAKSYTWRLWGAAWLIHEGAPDDTFDCFRSWLIGQGREAFKAAMDDPDSLADLATPEALDDQLAGVAETTYQAVTGKPIPSSAFELPKLNKKLDFNDSRAMARAYPKLFERFGSVHSQDPGGELLERCRKYAGAKGQWTAQDVEGFFHRFRPDGKGLSEIYSGVEFGDEITKRLIAVMKVDGTTKGSTLSANKLVPVSADRAMALVKLVCKNTRNLAREFDDNELAERFTARKFVLRAGQRMKYVRNDFTAEAIQMLCDAAFDVLYDSVAAANVLANAVDTLVGFTPLSFYIQWPIVADSFQVIDPFKPYFDLWCRGVEWRLMPDGLVEVFTP